ncbi:MAG: PepSY domain-containing protein [Gammaproteobacteria bacterium]|nr:PepSY domain-containing protein [Gammaproteobacteria bacterium]
MSRRLHRWLAWLFALPLIWLSLTGALLGFSAEMDRIMHVELMTTPLSQQPTLPESVQQALIHQSYPHHHWVAFTPAQNPVDTSMALLRDEQGELWQVFLNPKLGKINGVRRLAEDWTVMLTYGHKFVFLGDLWGEGIVFLSTIALLLVLTSGWQQARQQTHSVYSLHRLIGQWVTPLMLVVSLSGLLLFAQNSGWPVTSMNWASVHQGDWLGIPGRLLWVLVSLSLAWLIIGGLWLASTHQKGY